MPMVMESFVIAQRWNTFWYATMEVVIGLKFNRFEKRNYVYM
jgi:hypothetical protein